MRPYAHGMVTTGMCNMPNAGYCAYSRRQGTNVQKWHSEIRGTEVIVVPRGAVQISKVELFEIKTSLSGGLKKD